MDTFPLVEFYKDVDLLYAWVDNICKVKCPPNCDICCSRDIIWMTLPELIRIRANAIPRKVTFGCPYRKKEGGCGIYDLRPLVCRSFGPSQLRGKVLNALSVNVRKGEQDIAGPGICLDVKPESECDVDDLNRIYACYSVLTSWGLVAIGTCDDTKIQGVQEEVIRELQEKGPEYEIYVPDGNPKIKGQMQVFYEEFEKQFVSGFNTIP